MVLRVHHGVRLLVHLSVEEVLFARAVVPIGRVMGALRGVTVCCRWAAVVVVLCPDYW